MPVRFPFLLVRLFGSTFYKPNQTTQLEKLIRFESFNLTLDFKPLLFAELDSLSYAGVDIFNEKSNVAVLGMLYELGAALGLFGLQIMVSQILCICTANLGILYKTEFLNFYCNLHSYTHFMAEIYSFEWS